MKINEQFAAENRERMKTYSFNGKAAAFLCVHCGDVLTLIPIGLVSCRKCKDKADESFQVRKQRNLDRLAELEAREPDLIGQPDVW